MTIVRASVFLLGRGVLLSLADIPPGGATRLAARAPARQERLPALDPHPLERDLRRRHQRRRRDELRRAAGGGELAARRRRGRRRSSSSSAATSPSGASSPRSSSPATPSSGRSRASSARASRSASSRSGRSSSGPRSRGTSGSGTGPAAGSRCASPSPAAFIVPSHDYHSGARLVSISDRSPCTTLDELLDRFERSFVIAARGLAAGAPRRRGRPPHPLRGRGGPRAATAACALLSEAAQESRRAIAIETFLERLRDGGLHLAAGPLRGAPVPPLARGQPCRDRRGAGEDARGPVGHLPALGARAGLAGHAPPLLPHDRLRERAGGARRPPSTGSCSGPGACRPAASTSRSRWRRSAAPSRPPPRRTTSSPG